MKFDAVLARAKKEIPKALSQHPFKWKMDVVIGFGLGAGLSFDEALELRSIAADENFWM